MRGQVLGGAGVAQPALHLEAPQGAAPRNASPSAPSPGNETTNFVGPALANGRIGPGKHRFWASPPQPRIPGRAGNRASLRRERGETPHAARGEIADGTASAPSKTISPDCERGPWPIHPGKARPAATVTPPARARPATDYRSTSAGSAGLEFRCFEKNRSGRPPAECPGG